MRSSYPYSAAWKWSLSFCRFFLNNYLCYANRMKRGLQGVDGSEWKEDKSRKFFSANYDAKTCIDAHQLLGWLLKILIKNFLSPMGSFFFNFLWGLQDRKLGRTSRTCGDVKDTYSLILLQYPRIVADVPTRLQDRNPWSLGSWAAIRTVGAPDTALGLGPAY